MITKERPILFKGEMVRAILSGQKTQTRRICKPVGWRYEPVSGTLPYNWDKDFNPEWLFKNPSDPRGFKYVRCPYGQVGDRLWVRETWMEAGYCDPGWIFYKACDYLEQVKSHGLDRWLPESEVKWKPSIHMPRRASRITLEITDVRVERLQDIRESDARAEGVTIEERHANGYCAGEFLPPSIRAYRELWESINGPGSWDANPWVWVVSFRRIDHD